MTHAAANWYGLIAIGLTIVLSGAVLTLLYPEEPSLSGNGGCQEEDTSYYPGGRPCYPSEINRLPWLQRFERTEACEEAREQHRLNTNDLIQQRRSADAADAITVLSYQQTWIALLGLIVGFIAVFAAIFAAIYARKAADIADQTRIDENRPWLEFRRVPMCKFLDTGGNVAYEGRWRLIAIPSVDVVK